MNHEHVWAWIPALPAKKYEAESRRLLGQLSYLMLEAGGGVESPRSFWLCKFCLVAVR